MFIVSMPSPLNLCQLAAAIYRTVMEDTGVAEEYFATLEHERSPFLGASFLVPGMGDITPREGERVEVMQTTL